MPLGKRWLVSQVPRGLWINTVWQLTAPMKLARAPLASPSVQFLLCPVVHDLSVSALVTLDTMTAGVQRSKPWVSKGYEWITAGAGAQRGPRCVITNLRGSWRCDKNDSTSNFWFSVLKKVSWSLEMSETYDGQSKGSNLSSVFSLLTLLASKMWWVEVKSCWFCYFFPICTFHCTLPDTGWNGRLYTIHDWGSLDVLISVPTGLK